MWSRILSACCFITFYILLAAHNDIHAVVRLTTGPQPLPKRFLHRAPSSASSFSFQCPLFSLWSSSRCLRRLPLLPVTSFCIYPSIKCFRKQFLRKIWPIQLSFLLFIVRVCRIFLSSCVLRISFLTQSVQLISILLQHHISNLSIYYIWYNKYSRWIGRDEEGSFRNFEFEGDEDNRRAIRLSFVSQEKKNVSRYCNFEFLPARLDTKGHVTAVGSCRLGTLRYSDHDIMLGHSS
jgi:hypothetical protein